MKKKYLIPAVAAVSLGAASLYLLSLMPGRDRKEDFAPFEERMIAHRGLYDNDSDAPENSLPAFQKAVDAGYGIELDVQLTKDGRLVVFHDESLKRMCGVDGNLTDFTFDELERFSLAKSDARIPLYSDVLEIFRNKVPVIIELKGHGDYIGAAKKLMEYMDGYTGVYCVESFHPAIVRWFRKNRPSIIRGQLSTVFAKTTKVPWPARFAATNLLTNFLTRPNFIAYDFRYMDQFSYRLMRKLYKTENVAWTIQNEDDLKAAKDTFNIFIFDSFRPGR